MATMTRSDVVKFLAENDNYVILTHRRPDGDTIGSAAALCLGLRQLGKTAHVLVNAEVTPKYAHLLEGLTKVEAWAGDTVISVDVASFHMLPECYQKYSIALRIDHHGGSESFTENELVEPEAAACGDIIYDIIMSLYLDLDTPIANALYTAVSTDTGCFRYANTTSHSFAVAAACVLLHGIFAGMHDCTAQCGENAGSAAWISFGIGCEYRFELGADQRKSGGAAFGDRRCSDGNNDCMGSAAAVYLRVFFLWGTEYWISPV